MSPISETKVPPAAKKKPSTNRFFASCHRNRSFLSGTPFALLAILRTWMGREYRMGLGRDALARQSFASPGPDLPTTPPRLAIVRRRPVRRNRPVTILKVPRFWPWLQLGPTSSKAGDPLMASKMSPAVGLDAFGSEATPAVDRGRRGAGRILGVCGGCVAPGCPQMVCRDPVERRGLRWRRSLAISAGWRERPRPVL